MTKPSKALVDANTYALNRRLGRSIRSYREFLNVLLRQAMLGQRSFDDVAKAAAAVKPAVEMFLAEKQLATLQAGDHEADHSEEVLDTPPPALVFRRTKTVARTGLDKHGAVVDDKTVTIEGSAADAKAITADAEIETLM